MSPLRAAPASLHDAVSGLPAFGRYEGLVADLSTRRWDGDGGQFSPRRLQRKTWMYFGAFSETLMAGFAIADAGIAALAFVYVFDRAHGRMVEDKLSLPLGFARDFAATPDAPWSLARGARRWQITPSAEGWRAEFVAPQLQLTMDLAGRGAGMTTIAPAPGRVFHSTWKDCALAAQVRARIGDRELSATGTGMLDFTLGYPPRRTFWNWMALSGTTRDGRRVGLNLVAHFNNGLENALWLDDAILPLAQALFVYDPARLDQPWRITTADGCIDLAFMPEGRRAENLQALVMASRFVQLFGRFEGTIVIDGRAEAFSGFGVTEEHAALW